VQNNFQSGNNINLDLIIMLYPLTHHNQTISCIARKQKKTGLRSTGQVTLSAKKLKIPELHRH